MLETDAAWEVFERLEDCYFAVKEATERAAYTVNPGDMLTADEAETLRLMLKTAADRLKRGKEARGLMQAIGTSYSFRTSSSAYCMEKTCRAARQIQAPAKPA